MSSWATWGLNVRKKMMVEELVPIDSVVAPASRLEAFFELTYTLVLDKPENVSVNVSGAFESMKIKLKTTPKTLDDLVLLYYHESNPVTKAVRKDILDKKIYQEYID